MIRAGANALLPILIAASVLTACGPSATVEPEGEDENPPLLVESTGTVVLVDSTSTTVPVTAAPTEPATEQPDPVAPPDALDRGGVIAAVVLIAGGGDLEAAILEGVVTEAEAEAALLALENGTLEELLGAERAG